MKFAKKKDKLIIKKKQMLGLFFLEGLGRVFWNEGCTYWDAQNKSHWISVWAFGFSAFVTMIIVIVRHHNNLDTVFSKSMRRWVTSEGKKGA
jgi:hypothetical protein